jgi:hypothetical protein
MSDPPVDAEDVYMLVDTLLVPFEVHWEEV